MARPAIFLPLLWLFGTAGAQNSVLVRPAETFCGGIVNPPCTTQPRLIHSPEPKYPKHYGKVRLPQTVQLAIVVDPDGLTRDITVSRSLSPDFDERAIDAVKQWKFYPATHDGMRVSTKIQVDITFSRR